jgi:hypothetical protein
MIRRLRDPLFLLCLVAALLAIVVQSGEPGTADTMHRLQTAHSWWTDEPAVFPNEYPEFGVHGRGGKLYDWYGVGQPLLMLPVEIVGSYVEDLPIFDNYRATDPTVRNIFVVYTVNTFLSILTAIICFHFLGELGFTVNQSAAGVLALLFCTTHLHYTQNMMENNYIFLLTLAGFRYQYQWLRTSSQRALLIGSAAFGLNLLTRLTTSLDLISGGIFLLLVSWFEPIPLGGSQLPSSGNCRSARLRGRALWQRFLTYTNTAAPVYLVFIAIDRWYQWYRFGSIFSTYVRQFTIEHKMLDPTLPAKYPWETPFHVGFFGALFTPEKSIFLFDPLLLLTIIVIALAGKRFRPDVRAYLIATSFLLFAYICFYARYTVWSGDFAWGDRYVSTAAQFVAFISVPLLLHFRVRLGTTVWFVGMALIAVSTLIQLASLAFWLPLEIYQMDTLGHPTFVDWLRLKNIVAFAFGKMHSWGLTNDSMTYDPWDYVHITCWNFIPFLLRRVGVAPAWVVRIVVVLWSAAVAALIAALLQLRRVLRTSGEVRTSNSLS